MLKANLIKASMISTMLFATTQTVAYAQYPTKPVNIVVAFAPGGMTDIVTRLVARELSKKHGQSFVVENKAGVAGQVGTEYVARKENDGYTLLVAATGYVIAPATKKVNYRPKEDLELISVLAKAPNMLVVNPSVPAKTLPEFLDWGKKQSLIPYGSAGVGGSTHLGGEMLKKLTSLPLEHIPYKGAAPATNDVVAGQIPAAIQDSMSVSAFITTDQLRPIAVTSATRSALFPDLPTIKEHGYENFDVYTWLGLYAPAGTPKEVLETLNKSVNEIISSPEMKESLMKQHSEPGDNLTLDEAKVFLNDELQKWEDLVKISEIQTEK